MIGIDFGITAVSIYEQDDPCCQKLFLYMESVVSTTVMFALEPLKKYYSRFTNIFDPALMVSQIWRPLNSSEFSIGNIRTDRENVIALTVPSYEGIKKIKRLFVFYF